LGRLRAVYILGRYTKKMEQSTENSIFQTSLRNFELTADRLDLDEDARQRLLGAKEKIELRIAPMMPTGHVRPIKAFIVKHQDALGPAKGGIRMTPEVTMDDIGGLAMEMTWKTALIGVPFGGGKSGIQCDTRELAPEARQVIVRAFTRAARRHIGPEVYIPAPDMGTNETDMGHIRDCISYSDAVSITNGCFVTGKPVILGGILGRREATGKGVVYTIQAMCSRAGLDMEKARVVLQGFGNVGSVTALEMARRGARVLAVSDLSGTR
jgi:glutamate dehydrogenase (NAD(P)+)